jgi:predicted ATPase/DNA-binding SARP family transcriptional activator/Flp pilus assembly protein TadD
MLEIRALGGLSLRENGQAIENLGSRKAEALLIYLAVEDRELNRDLLAALFWPESNQTRASTSLRVTLSILRKHLGAYVDISRNAVRLDQEAEIYFDLSDFEGKLINGDVQGALDIYQGDFLEGFYVRDSPEFEDWLRFEQERVRRSLINALHQRITGEIGAGAYAKGLSFVRRLLAFDPLDELAYQQCMQLLALTDQRTAALGEYETCCQVLGKELGIEPSRETKELYEKISAGEGASYFETLIPAHNLPAPQTSFIGRERELFQIGELVRDPACRLVTVMGMAGSGKTRLALQAATRVLRSFPDGVYFIPLEALSSPKYLVPALSDALPFNVDNLASRLDQKTQLLHYLSDQALLLVLDGFEHLIDGAGLLSEILEAAPEVQILVTSRQKLNLKGEWTVLLEGLAYPQQIEEHALEDFDAVTLFLDRAQQTKTDFNLCDSDQEHVARICQLLEGMPLGIELAAAQISLLSPSEFLVEMEKSLDFFSTSMRDVAERHRSLRAAFDNSWVLLMEDEKETFAKLSVFQGGFDREAAREVAGASLSQLSSLLNKSLLRRDEVGDFSMHGLLREHAAEKLSQQAEIEEEIKDRHCQYYVNLLRQREDDFYSAKALQVREEIRRDVENIRAAVLRASLSWDPKPIRRVLIALLGSFVVEDWHEGADAFQDIARWREEALLQGGDSNPEEDPVVLSAWTHQAFLLTNLGQIEESEVLSRDCVGALEELGLEGELSECLHNLGVNASFQGRYEQARELLEEAILLGRACDHPVWPTYLLWLGHAYFLLGEYEEGLISLRKSQELFERKGTLWGSGFALSKMGLAADGLGNHVQAKAYHGQALKIFERVGNQAGKSYSLSRMSMSAYLLGDYKQAVRLAEEGYQFSEGIGHRWGMCTSLGRLGFAHLGLGQVERAKGYFEEALQGARQDHMLPLVLYALAGLACTMAQRGNEETACELFHYVQRHPETPALYLEVARCWISGAIQKDEGGSSFSEEANRALEPVDQLIDRLLR